MGLELVLDKLWGHVLAAGGYDEVLLPVGNPEEVIGIEFAFLMGGLVVTEQVFNLNGLGKLFVESVLNNDYNLTQALAMNAVMVLVVTNFVVDLFYAWLDPRIRYS